MHPCARLHPGPRERIFKVLGPAAAGDETTDVGRPLHVLTAGDRDFAQALRIGSMALPTGSSGPEKDTLGLPLPRPGA